MVKYLFILINSISLFLYSLFSGDGGITVTNNFPNAIKPGQTVKVEVRINKGGMSGFAKMQLELPAGISVNEIDSKDANFTYEEGLAKWIWASLPADKEIVLKFALVADAAASPGKAIISGKYSYVGDNGKEVVEMNPVEITIGGEGAVANTSNENNNQAQNTATQTATDNTAANTPTETMQSNSNREPDGNITVKRSIVKGFTEGEYIINLVVDKGSTKGFARYSDDLPADLAARSAKTEGASFSVADGKIKFVWVAVPEKERLELSYIISGVTKPVTLNGEYSFLEQNQSKKYDLTPETITPETPVAVNTNTESVTTNTSTETTTTNAVTDNSTNTNTTSVNSESTAVTTPTKSNTTEPNEALTKNEGNVKYHVQIGAFTNSEVTTARLKKKFGINENIQSEFQGGFSKFMVGTHAEYKAARDHREQVKSGNGVKTAFVVAYNTGKRITVQEALMISNQKWFK
jgi:cell division septation protein DedD